MNESQESFVYLTCVRDLIGQVESFDFEKLLSMCWRFPKQSNQINSRHLQNQVSVESSSSSTSPRKKGIVPESKSYK